MCEIYRPTVIGRKDKKQWHWKIKEAYTNVHAEERSENVSFKKITLLYK